MWSNFQRKSTCKSSVACLSRGCLHDSLVTSNSYVLLVEKRTDYNYKILPKITSC